LCAAYAILDRGIDLILHRTVTCPTCCHVRSRSTLRRRIFQPPMVVIDGPIASREISSARMDHT
jgi:hypothetical protein